VPARHRPSRWQARAWSRWYGPEWCSDMRRRARHQPKADDVEELIRSWAVVVEVDCDGPAQVVAAGAELHLEITSGPLVSVLAAVLEAARRARGSALLCVVEPAGASSFVV